MKSISKIIGFVLMFLLLLTACKSTQNTSVKTENFDQFYQKFHQDEDFQFSRIKFPLQGGLVDSFSKTKWTKTNWIPMKVPVYDVDKTQYNVTVEQTDKMFSQKVWIPDSGFSSEHWFELIKGKWYLVFARETNF